MDPREPRLGQLVEGAGRGQNRLAVLGSPIGHSKSPRLHAAAYRALGLDWHYEAIEVTAETLPDFVRTRGGEWRGLSLTMPLKREVLPLLDSRDAVVNLAGGANTVVFDGGPGRHDVPGESEDANESERESASDSASDSDSDGVERAIRGFNTDVFGIREAFESNGVRQLGYVELLGGGATASSTLVAANQLGADRALIIVRTPLKALELAQLGKRLGMDVTVQAFSDEAIDRPKAVPDAVVSPLPGGVTVESDLFTDRVRNRAVLFDVAYDPWPSALANDWLAAGGTVISGLDMLLYQALAQVRLFVGGDALTPLPDEAGVLKAMKAALEH
jgi:shikimate dehydrogenase